MRIHPLVRDFRRIMICLRFHVIANVSLMPGSLGEPLPYVSNYSADFATVQSPLKDCAPATFLQTAWAFRAFHCLGSLASRGLGHFRQRQETSFD